MAGESKVKPDDGYFEAVVKGAKSVLDGMAVTFSYLFRKPVTIEYPDRVPIPIPETLPERYRGFLEVDMDICTACKACERDCPINVIVIDIEKIDGVRAMTRFDIDLGKCMYCGICVESCPTDAKAPGDDEQTKCIRFTREFEGATSDFPTLTFRMIRPGDYVVPYKPKKGEVVDTSRRGILARAIRVKAREYNVLASTWALANGGGPKKSGGIELVIAEEVVVARAKELLPMIEPIKNDVRGLETLLYDQALAQTDCEACGWPTCREYADAMLLGKDTEFFKCEPGGAASTRDMNLILHIRLGKTPEEASKLAIAQVKQKHA